MSTAFDPALFLSATQTEVNERRPLLPVDNPTTHDGLYVGVIGEIKMDSGIIGKGDNTGKPWVSVVIPIKIDVPQELQDSLKLPSQLTFSDRAFLDLTDNNTIDNSPGKNRAQKNYRDATGLNNPGEPFSWLMVQGRPVKVKVAWEDYQGVQMEKIANVFKAA